MKLTSLLALLLAATPLATQAQSVLRTPAQHCEHALANPVARYVMPALNSNAIRDAVCDCVRAAALPSAAAASVPATEALAAETARTCMARAAPAERQVPLPRESLLALQDALDGSLSAAGQMDASIDLRNCPRPEYPMAAAQANATGVTRLVLQVNRLGQVVDAEVARSAGTTPYHKMLDAAALVALMRCNVSPARWHGHVIDGWVSADYVWKLR